MSKLLPLVVVLTVIPGFLWWIVIAAMTPGLLMLLEDLAEWRDRARPGVLIPVRVDRRDLRDWRAGPRRG